MKKCTITPLETSYFDAVLAEYVGKDVVMYDEHHGSARLVKNASLEMLEELNDEYNVIIVL